MRNTKILIAAFLIHGAALAAEPGFGEGRFEHSLAADVNPAGLMAGEIRNDEGQRRAVVYRNGKVTDLGTLGGTDSYATGINAAGTVTGGALDGTNRWRAFRWQQGAGMRDLGTLGGSSSLGTAINGTGQIAGYADIEDGSFHAFVHDGPLHGPPLPGIRRAVDDRHGVQEQADGLRADRAAAGLRGLVPAQGLPALAPWPAGQAGSLLSAGMAA